MDDRTFLRRLLTGVGVALVVLALLVLLQRAAAALLVLFAGVLLAVLLDALVGLLRARVRLPHGAALAVVMLGLGSLVAAFVLLAGPHVAAQVDQLGERIPRAFERLTTQLRRYQWGRHLLSQATSPDKFLGASGGRGGITTMLSSVVGSLTNLLIVLFVGLYLAADPRLYREGALKLIPKRRRGRVAEVFAAQAHALRHWLAGQFVSMTIVGALTTAGLLVLGIPLALVLGLIAGLLNFVPYVGPFLSVFPALLVALVESPQQVMFVVGLYASVQLLESYVITPLVQRRAVSLPPALLITAEVLAAVLFGPLGMVLAAPLAVVAIVAVQLLYVQDVLGEDVKVMGE